MSLSRGLIQFRLFNKLGKEKQELVSHLFDNIEPILSRITEMFVDYTPHGLKHILELIKNLDRILDAQIDNFNEDQFFCILIATIIHDIGMMHNLFSDDDWEINDESRQTIREIHHLRSQRFVEELLNIDISPEIRKSIGLIAKGHRNVPLSHEEYTSNDGRIENLDVLSASLRLADELDFAYGRIEFLDFFSDKSVFLSKLQKESLSFWKSHMVLQAWEIRKEQSYLFIKGEVCDLEGQLALEYMKQKIQKTLDGIRNIKFNGIYIFPFSTYFVIKFRGFIEAEYHVEVDSGIIETIIGSIYKDRIEALRECIQNSIDACLVQKALQTDYNPQICVKLEKDTISVLDNGCGMTQHIIEHYLRVVGRSYYQSVEFASLQYELDNTISVIGMYGVGIFSLLLLTDLIHIKTCSSQNGGKWLEVQMSHSFTPIYEIDRQDIGIEHGTFLDLKLTKKIYTNIEKNVLSFLNYAFPRPSIDLTVVLDSVENEIGVFPIFEEEGTISNPQLTINDGEVLISGLNEDGIFLGLTNDFTLVEYGEKRYLDDLEDKGEEWNTQIIIALGGSRIANVEMDSSLYNSLHLLTNLIREISSFDVIYPFIDFPVGRIIPTLSKTDILEGQTLIKKTQESFVDLIKGCIIKLKEIYYKEGKIHEFWDHLTGSNYVSRFVSEFDINEIIPNIEIWKPGTKKRIGDLDASDEKILNMGRILNEFEISADISPDDGWIPFGHYEFVREHVISEFRKRGWILNFPVVHHTFSDDYEWEHIEKVLEVLEENEREEAICSIIYCLGSASDDFLRQISLQATKNNWSNLSEILTNPEYHYLELYKLRLYIFEEENKNPNDLLDFASNELDFDDFLHLIIFVERYNEGLILLKKEIERGMELKIAYSLWRSLDSKGFMYELSQRYPDEFQQIQKRIFEMKEKYLEDMLAHYSS